MATLERAIVAAAAVALNNRSLKRKDLQEWSSAEIKQHDGEVVIWLPDPGVYAAFPAAAHKDRCIARDDLMAFDALHAAGSRNDRRRRIHKLARAVELEISLMEAK
jgi:hypothetical protein